jgi:hypothetical protein
MQNDGRHKTIRATLGVVGLSFSLIVGLGGCHSNTAANSGPDPAQANLAPVNGQTQVLASNASYTPQQQGESYENQSSYPQQAPAPIVQGYNNQPGYDQGYDQTEAAGEEAIEQTNQAPPPLPEYDQPPCPGPNYLWTPGYWAWGPSGYYWVPGAWVEAPYYGALWTPPYWGWNAGYYRFYPGYWGPHVGFYGGVNYGFGYIGIGFFGGYWSGNSFYYNRSVTRVGPSVRAFYDRPVVYNNVHYGMQPSNRVSFNGGRGGINVRPTAAETAAARERHDPPMAVQHQARVAASQNRNQFYTENHGRPATAVEAHGFANSRGIAAPPRGVQPGRANMPAPNALAERGAAPARGSEARPGVNPATAPRENAAPRPAPGVRPTEQPRPEARPTEQPRPEARPMEQPRTEQPRPAAPEPRVENRPAPQPRADQAPRPEPQPRAEAPRPAPAPHAAPAPRPAPAPHAAPHPSGGEEHGHR